MHWDGTRWAPSLSGVTDEVDCLWGSGPDDVWAFIGLGDLYVTTGSITGTGSIVPAAAYGALTGAAEWKRNRKTASSEPSRLVRN